jgi:zinc protease
VKADFPGPTPGVYFADKEDVDQSTVEIVGLGTERSNPDFYALSVMNEVFSGGFGSRVVQYVRTKLGLAYDVGGSFGALYDHPGIFLTVAGTKSATTVAATKAVLEEIGRLKTVPPTPAEMRKAKDQVINSFIFNYDTPEKTLSEQVTLASTATRRTSSKNTRTASSASPPPTSAASPTSTSTCPSWPSSSSATNRDRQPPLSTLGKVTDLDITIPPPPGKPAQ